MKHKTTFSPTDYLRQLHKALNDDVLETLLKLASDLAEKDALPIVELFSATQKLRESGHSDQAIALYRTWLEHTTSPIAYAVQFNLAVCLNDVQDDVAAEAAYRRALELNPDFIEAQLNLGTLLERHGLFEEALSLWREVSIIAQRKPDINPALHIQALNNLGRLLELRKRLEEAEQILTQSLKIDPKQPKVLAHIVHLRQKQCEWPVYHEIEGVTPDEMLQATSALAMLSASDDPALQLAASRNYVEEQVNTHLEPLADMSGYAHKRLRIGYLSSDFHAHAVAILTAELFELHDRAKIEVYGFCWSSEDGSPIRARIIKAMDHFINIAEMSDEQAARCIRSHEIDILVDLHGLTLGTRPNILSWRPAPVQVTYLGFPGPSALPCIDYVVADKFVLPPELTPYFTERPLYMPHSFQINDRQREVGPCPTRAECSLPDDAFVFCSFNNNFKITEEIFTTWMRILSRVPGSVLWLVSDHQSVRRNLAAHAQRLGVDPARLLFAERVSPAAYLARYQVADLFLDTIPFNAGTTASDALWAGLPLLTCVGRTFCSRMAGSLLMAVDLPQLITYDLQEYENKAVSLAGQPDQIAAMKRQLKENRLSCSLFDSPQFVRDLEDIYQSVAKSHNSFTSSIQPASINTIISKERPMKLPDHTPIEEPSRVMNFMVPTVWGLTDPVRFYALMAEAQKLIVPGSYLGDNLFTWGKSNSPFEDKAFVNAWESNIQNDADKAIAWRRYILACSAYHCAQLPGDFVECGVYRGTGIKTVIDYFGKDEFTKTYWGYDTYDYNPVEHHTFAGQKDGLFNEIQQRFAGYDRVNLVKGLLPESLVDNSPEQIAFLHIDLNNAEYEIAVLDVLFDRVVSGGMVILDDYEWAGEYRLQKIAEDAWFDKRKYRVFPLPTGQGLVLKR